MTVVLARRRHLHAFAFRWGVVVRIRRRTGDWIHVSLHTRTYEWRHYPARHSRSLELEVWLTSQGTIKRVPGSKRYIRMKVAL